MISWSWQSEVSTARLSVSYNLSASSVSEACLMAIQRLSHAVAPPAMRNMKWSTRVVVVRPFTGQSARGAS
eukprot:6706619-Pyramimonas_sp.AAC.1